MQAQSNVELTTQPAGSLVFEQLPSGEYAWLRPDTERAALNAAIRDADALGQDMDHRLGWPSQARVTKCGRTSERADTRYGIADMGRDALARAVAMDNLFGPDWPTVAESCALNGVAC
jgi:hypothetical protein